jgi:hypothetical protein
VCYHEQALELKTAGNIRTEVNLSDSAAPWAEHAETLLSPLLNMADGSGSARDLLQVDRILRLQNRGLKAMWQELLDSCGSQPPSVRTLAWLPSLTGEATFASILEHGFCWDHACPGCAFCPYACNRCNKGHTFKGSLQLRGL